MSREEDHVVSALINLAKKHGTQTIMQVGAEDGYEANEIRKATGCRAIAIDADTDNRPCSPDLEFHYVLVGATNCDTTPFYRNLSHALSSMYQRGSDHGEERIEIPQTRLDFFCGLRGLKPDALIVDTEGSTLDVLEGCGDLLQGVNWIYAEVQAYAIRPGIRPVGEVDALLLPMGFAHHRGLPSYDGGAQSNLTWVRK